MHVALDAPIKSGHDKVGGVESFARPSSRLGQADLAQGFDELGREIRAERIECAAVARRDLRSQADGFRHVLARVVEPPEFGKCRRPEPVLKSGLYDWGAR